MDYIEDFPYLLGVPHPRRIAHGPNNVSPLRIIFDITFTWLARSLREAQFLRPPVYL